MFLWHYEKWWNMDWNRAPSPGISLLKKQSTDNSMSSLFTWSKRGCQDSYMFKWWLPTPPRIFETILLSCMCAQQVSKIKVWNGREWDEHICDEWQPDTPSPLLKIYRPCGQMQSFGCEKINDWFIAIKFLGAPVPHFPPMVFHTQQMEDYVTLVPDDILAPFCHSWWYGQEHQDDSCHGSWNQEAQPNLVGRTSSSPRRKWRWRRGVPWVSYSRWLQWRFDYLCREIWRRRIQ